MSRFTDWLARVFRPRGVPSVAQPVTPLPAVALGQQDRDAVIRTLYGEARGQPDAGKIAVCHAIRNRVNKAKTSAYVECHRPWQFSCWNAADPNLPKMLALKTTDPVYTALGAVVDRAWAMPDTVGGARHYYAASMAKPPFWARPPGRMVAKIGDHYFWANVA